MPAVMGYLVSCIIYHIREAVKIHKEHGRFWTTHNSAYLLTRAQRVEDEWTRASRFNLFNIFGVLGRTFVHLIQFVLHSATIYYATLAHLNFSLIINLYSLTPFFTAVAFFLLFREKLSKYHIVGMFFIFGCVYITGKSETTKKLTNTMGAQQEESVSPLIPVGMAIMSTLCFTASNSIGRFTIKNCRGSLTSQQLIADSYLLQSFIMLLALLV